MSVKIYGIKNCDTMKKAFSWLDEHQVEYVFHDYKKQGADEDILRAAMAVHGWEAVINRRGTSWRTLPEEAKAGMDEARAVVAALDNPSLVKRPLMVADGESYLGFDVAVYARLFS